MQQIIDQLNEWQYIQQLPSELHGFILQKDFKEDGSIYHIFTYINQRQRRSFSILYDHSTKEYIARITAGLIEFCDIAYIVADLEMLEKLLKERLEKTLLQLGIFDINDLDSVFREKKIVEWPYAAGLPQTIDGFELYIKPAEPLKIINGSYVILDYSDFSSESNLILYYNIYRDEFFGEIRIKRTPQMAAVFESKSLPELEEKLELYLTSTLEEIRNQLL
ncbi:hypothetical protein SDC9_133197 [bioreactor metagenome]|jgi:hypothetical protein|uniref:Uncharacterized protein n=1 Tax=bioreactor metagenome TaxID=1076179 RepID=A0A645D9U3_9ZZZZ